MLRSALEVLRSIKRPNHTSTFRTTGELTPEEFVLTGDYLSSKFPTWQWSGGDDAKRKDFLPNDKQFLVTKHVPCFRRLDEDFAGGWEGGDGPEFDDGTAAEDTTETGKRHRKVKSVDDTGVVEESGAESEDDIPDMEDDDDDEAIIRDTDTKKGGEGSGKGTTAPRRTYNLYIIYNTWYRTPCLYLSGYDGATQLPLTPEQMMEDIMGDYKDKTVTIDRFPHLEGDIRMASIHPCKHASVMRTLLDRADAAVKLKRKRILAAARGEQHHEESNANTAHRPSNKNPLSSEGDSNKSELLPDIARLTLEDREISHQSPQSQPKSPLTPGSGIIPKQSQPPPPPPPPLGIPVDEWEEIAADAEEDGSGGEGGGEGGGIRVDQYLVVFLKFMASVTPGIEHDFTMGL